MVPIRYFQDDCSIQPVSKMYVKPAINSMIRESTQYLAKCSSRFCGAAIISNKSLQDLSRRMEWYSVMRVLDNASCIHFLCSRQLELYGPIARLFSQPSLAQKVSISAYYCSRPELTSRSTTQNVAYSSNCGSSCRGDHGRPQVS